MTRQALSVGLRRRRDLLVAFAARDFKVRYYSVRLGALYAFGVSLLTMAVLSAALGRVFRDSVQGPYPLFVFAALIPWNFLTFTLNQSSDSFRSSASIVRRVPFPRELVPLGVVATNLLNMTVSFGAFVPVALLFGVRPTWTWLALPVPILALVMLVSGLALIVATAGVFYVEVKPVVEVLVMLAFYATPIFYPESVVPSRFLWVLHGNPMAHLVDVFRSLLVQGRWPSAVSIAYPAAVATVALASGWWLLRRVEGVIADRVS